MGPPDTPSCLAKWTIFLATTLGQKFLLAPASLKAGVSKLLAECQREVIMGTVVHTCRSRIVREEGPTRKAIIEGFPGEVRYGVHGGIKKFYGIEPREEHAATLDHIVTAVAA